jgi:hypothetical protein
MGGGAALEDRPCSTSCSCGQLSAELMTVPPVPTATTNSNRPTPRVMNTGCPTHCVPARPRGFTSRLGADLGSQTLAASPRNHDGGATGCATTWTYRHDQDRLALRTLTGTKVCTRQRDRGRPKRSWTALPAAISPSPLGHRGHGRIRVVEQPGGGRVRPTLMSGPSDLVYEETSQRHSHRHQQPHPKPARNKHPHARYLPTTSQEVAAPVDGLS